MKLLKRLIKKQDLPLLQEDGKIERNMISDIDSFEAYASMCNFLDRFYFKHSQDDLGDLLSSMSINPNDGLPMDSGMKSVWENFFLKKFKDNNIKVNSQQAYSLMISFLKDINNDLKSDEINEMIYTLELEPNSFLKEWMDSINEIQIKYSGE